jgi:ubiquinone/menaquinone biosynthesis C-methylase UbiE
MIASSPWPLPSKPLWGLRRLAFQIGTLMSCHAPADVDVLAANAGGSARKRHALELFSGLGAHYDTLSAALSLGQDPRWRRALVSALGPTPGELVLDVATGTGMVAAELLTRGCSVVGIDQSAEMLAVARARFGEPARTGWSHPGAGRSRAGAGPSHAGGGGSHAGAGGSQAGAGRSHAEGEGSHAGAGRSRAEGEGSHAGGGQSHAGAGQSHAGAGQSHAGAGQSHAGGGQSHAGGLGSHAGDQVHVRWVQGQAEALPFPDASFDALTFTYLLRYVDDPAATMRELARVIRPGGRIGSLEFGVPPWPPARAAWRLYTRVGLPILGRLVSREWGAVGRFLGPSIAGFYARHPLERITGYWQAAGLEHVHVRRMSLGGGVVMWARRSPAEQAAAGDGGESECGDAGRA